MKPQTFNLNSEVLDEFRDKMNAALAAVVKQLKRRNMREGKITGQIHITLEDTTTEEGEVVTQMEIEPEVTMNISAKGKLECSKQSGLFTRLNNEGEPVIGSCQIDMDELLAEEKGE